MYDVSFAPVSNRAAWVEVFEIPDTDGNGVALDDAVFEIDGPCGRIVKKLNDGLSYEQGTATLTLTIDDSEMRRLRPGTARAGLVVTIAGEPVQILVGTVPVIDGEVP